jgi:phosphoribosyl 1,2-cyclic phosphodiesterase
MWSGWIRLSGGVFDIRSAWKRAVLNVNERRLKLTFRGVRGSICRPGGKFLRYGGNTTCADVRLSEREWLILDCGSGMPELHPELPATVPQGGLRFHVLLTHYHRDHLEGLPFFRPLHDPACSFTFYGFPWESMGVREALETGLRPPWFPVPIGDTPSTKSYVDLTGSPLRIDGIKVSTARLSHPQGSTAYRLERSGGTVVFATDTEYGDDELDARLVELSRGAKVLIHDAQYTPDEYDDYRGHGHSTWRHAVEIARAGAVERLVLFHHDPERSDDELDAIAEQARSAFAAVECAREGASIPL